MLVRKSRFDAVIEENNKLRGFWRRESDERIHDVNQLTRECREREDEVKLLKENLNNVTAELTRERSARIDAEKALKETRESYGDVEVDGVMMDTSTNGYTGTIADRNARSIAYNENARYAELFDGQGRYLSGHQDVVAWRYVYRQTEE